jgi:hypothetical protein
VPLSIGAMTHVPRVRESVIGARLGTVIDDGIVPKHVIVNGGYDLRIFPGRFVFQPALELGVGSPVSRSYGSPGAYLGASGAIRVRMVGTSEDVAYNVLSNDLDFVILPRFGGWMPPEGSGSTRLAGEWAVEAGFRLDFGSDVFSPTRGKVEEPPTVTEPAP